MQVPFGVFDGAMKIVFDPTLMRPGCALLQATLGALWTDLAFHFPPHSWLTFPTPGMGVYEVTPDQLAKLSAHVKRAYPERGRPPV